jgi:hypothetical protein
MDANPSTIQKSRLVAIGQYALSHGEWQMVLAITRLIQERGWGGE